MSSGMHKFYITEIYCTPVFEKDKRNWTNKGPRFSFTFKIGQEVASNFGKKVSY